ncbi:MAG: hypothetical protein Q9216_002258 [Gyalolechia sp. 2 TL-2023]
MSSVRTARNGDSLRAFPHDDTTAAQPPIPVTGATPPILQPTVITGLQNPKSSPDQQWLPRIVRSTFYDDSRRDSGLAPSNSAAQESRATLSTDNESSQSVQTSPALRQESGAENDTVLASTVFKTYNDSRADYSASPQKPQMPFLGIVTQIPTGSFDDLTLPGQVEFSSRGSMFIGGKKAKDNNGSTLSRPVRSRKQSVPLSQSSSTASKRILSIDEEMLSNKVRNMYEDGTENTRNSNGSLSGTQDEDAQDTLPRASSPELSNSVDMLADSTSTARASIKESGHSSASRNLQTLIREEQELAGGIEDWENVASGDVDRYGFIIPSRASQNSSLDSIHLKPRDPPRIQRVSTVLQIASEAPRRRRSRLGRGPPSAKSPARSATAIPSRWTESRNSRPASSQSSYRSTLNTKQAKLRNAALKLPYHQNRRVLEEAGDMLTLPPGLADTGENEEDGRAAEESRQRERRREEKWQKMAKVVNGDDRRGGGMVFDFDTKSPKVIERTWKGIPDRWRATAWHSFLSASARKRKDLPSDDQLKGEFHKLMEHGSPDDAQIDIDVPRTINSHIMFRRRYRGGQRLLFRVLHCLSIYFPDTGYVQGMAALAATFLCYFDEEMTFVMLVRLWQLRGLERLYQSGFEGLMQALEEFEKGWLANGEVSTKLDELNITPTAYGTRWYLTLFNYSIPFPAQLRVWDVFMLLGDPDDDDIPSSSSRVSAIQDTVISDSYRGGLDVLHAVSAALIDGTREILLDSDFENAMKVLTSWIPIRDEELLMRVAKAEWRMHRRKKVNLFRTRSLPLSKPFDIHSFFDSQFPQPKMGVDGEKERISAEITRSGAVSPSEPVLPVVNPAAVSEKKPDPPVSNIHPAFYVSVWIALSSSIIIFNKWILDDGKFRAGSRPMLAGIDVADGWL